jgi:NMD protein affecting ribosome stability and mRNA decay
MKCSACEKEIESDVPGVCQECYIEGWRIPSPEIMKAAGITMDEEGLLSLPKEEEE